MKKLQNRTWAVFAIFSVVIIGSVWIFQTLIFDRLYFRQELARIEKLGNEVSDEWKPVRFSRPASIRFYRDEVSVRIFNNAGARSTEDMGTIADPNPLGAAEFINKYEASGEKVYLNVIRNNRTDAGFIIYGAKLINPVNADNSLYVYIVDPLGPLYTVRTIMMQLLLLMCLVSLALALILSYFLATTVSKPIVSLTEQTKLLAKGDYSVRFDGSEITEIRQLSETLNMAAEQLAVIDETKNELLASVSHDLRTPLTMIQAYAEMIRDLSGEDREKRNEHIGIILQETDWMSKLITDILEYSRIRSGTMHYEMELFDLADLTELCVENFNGSPAANERNVTIAWEPPGYMPVWGDITRIKRVINNLLDNAVKYTKEGTTVRVSVFTQDEKTVFEVQDQGPGIPEKALDSIWDRYFSAEEGRSRKTGSTGLGLSIVRGILKAHGAGYGVRSREGSGSTFWFSMRSEGVSFS